MSIYIVCFFLYAHNICFTKQNKNFHYGLGFEWINDYSWKLEIKYLFFTVFVIIIVIIIATNIYLK